MQFGGIDWRRWQWLRIAPHLNDTLLLAAAIALAAMSAQYPFVQGWLTAKLLALLAYIALGRVALGKEGSPRRRAPRSGRRCWWWATSSPWRSRGRPAWACYSANRGRTKRKTSRSCARRSHPPARCCRCCWPTSRPTMPRRLVHLGSTGHPKGVVARHRNIVSALLSWEIDRAIGEALAGTWRGSRFRATCAGQTRRCRGPRRASSSSARYAMWRCQSGGARGAGRRGGLIGRSAEGGTAVRAPGGWRSV